MGGGGGVTAIHGPAEWICEQDRGAVTKEMDRNIWNGGVFNLAAIHNPTARLGARLGATPEFNRGAVTKETDRDIWNSGVFNLVIHDPTEWICECNRGAITKEMDRDIWNSGVFNFAIHDPAEQICECDRGTVTKETDIGKEGV